MFLPTSQNKRLKERTRIKRIYFPVKQKEFKKNFNWVHISAKVINQSPLQPPRPTCSACRRQACVTKLVHTHPSSSHWSQTPAAWSLGPTHNRVHVATICTLFSPGVFCQFPRRTYSPPVQNCMTVCISHDNVCALFVSGKCLKS